MKKRPDASRRSFLRKAITGAGATAAAAFSGTAAGAQQGSQDAAAAAPPPIRIPAEFAAAQSAEPRPFTFPMTGALCTAAAAHIPGTVVHETVGAASGGLRIRHPKGIVELAADVAADVPEVVVRSVGVVRTARRLMTGEAHVVVPD